MGFVARGPNQSDTAKLGALVTYAGDAPLITFAPTGEGKTSGPVVCNALNHPGQLIVVDPKGEVCHVTARRRRELGQEVHILDLRDDGNRSGCLNPLDLAVRCGSETAAIARSFAADLVERTGAERELFWADSAETLLGGGVAWLLADCPPEDRRMAKLFDLFNNDDVVYRIATLLDAKKVRNRAAYAAFTAFLGLPDRETRPSVLASAQQHIRLFDSDLVRRLTDCTSFDLDALIAGKPMSLYIVIPPARLTAYKPLLRCWLSGLLFALTQRRTVPEHRTLMLCDEIASLGRMNAFLMATTLMRGWGLTLWSFWQNPAQLEVYGADARTLVDNAGVIQLFGARNRRIADELASLVGGIDADEILRMPRDQQLLLIEGGHPQIAQRIRYFEDSHFRALYDDNPLAAGRG